MPSHVSPPWQGVALRERSLRVSNSKAVEELGRMRASGLTHAVLVHGHLSARLYVRICGVSGEARDNTTAQWAGQESPGRSQ